MAPVLDVVGITLRFRGLVALDDLSLSVEPGHVHGVIGPNGAGKTTLFDVITGVYRPHAGSIVFDGRDVTRWSSHRRAHAGLARTFQTVGLAGGLTARENILATIEAVDRVWSPYPLPGPAGRRKRRTEAILDEFGLQPVADRLVADLPLGTTKLLELAKAFAGGAKLVLLDEPFAGLSHSEGVERVELLARRRDETGVTVVIVEHDLPLLMQTCDRLSVLDYGTLVAHGEPDSVMASAEVRRAYMGEVVGGQS